MTWKAGHRVLQTVNMLDGNELFWIQIYPEEQDDQKVSGSQGTAWCVEKSGHYVTNAHVVLNADEIAIGFSEADSVPARVVRIDRRTDLALLRVTTENHECVPIPLSGVVPRTGDDITVIGFPLSAFLGSEPRMNSGIVNARSGIAGDITRFQIDAAVQPGSSGGPVLDGTGSVVGIVVEKLKDSASPDMDVENVNFAIKISYLRPLLDEANVVPVFRESVHSASSHSDVFRQYERSVVPVRAW